MKTRLPGKIPRERYIWCKYFVTLPGKDTTSELPVGNGWTGAPVIVPMSGEEIRNQGGTVEYFVSHP